MNDMLTKLVEKLIEKRGLGFLFLIFVLILALFVIGVWCIQRIAAPGQPVSVWGIQFTKQADPPISTQVFTQDSQQPNPPISSQASIPAAPIAAVLPAIPDKHAQGAEIQQHADPIDLYVRNGLTPTTAKQLQVTLRADHQLRPLSSAEDGKNIKEISAGTYFYTSGAWIKTFGRETLLEAVANLATRAEAESPAWIEIHELSQDELVLLAFTDQDSASRAAHLSGLDTIDITVAPEYSEHFSSMLLIPLRRVSGSRPRELRSPIVIDLTLK